MRRYLGAKWEPQRIARDGDGLPTLSNTVNELALCYSGLVRNRKEDWIWEAMVRHPDLVGGFNRLDTTVIKSGHGRVIAKEGADGLLGLAIDHDDYPEGLGIVVKIAHGWNPQAAWYVARGILGVLGIELRNPYPLRRQALGTLRRGGRDAGESGRNKRKAAVEAVNHHARNISQ